MMSNTAATCNGSIGCSVNNGRSQCTMSRAFSRCVCGGGLALAHGTHVLCAVQPSPVLVLGDRGGVVWRATQWQPRCGVGAFLQHGSVWSVPEGLRSSQLRRHDRQLFVCGMVMWSPWVCACEGCGCGAWKPSFPSAHTPPFTVFRQRQPRCFALRDGTGVLVRGACEQKVMSNRVPCRVAHSE